MLSCSCCERLSCPAILPQKYRQWWKWIVTIALAVVYFVSWGNIHSYPLLFGPLQDEFKTTAVETGWVGSVTIGINSLASPLAALLERKVGFRMTTVLGVLLCSVGVFSSSFAPQLFYLYFTYGLVYGVGINLTFHTSLCLMVQYFPVKNCRRATSIIMCGGTTGMLIFSPFMERMIKWLTWRGALRISGSFVLCLGIPFALLCKSPEETSKQLEEVDKKCSKYAEVSETPSGKTKHDLQRIYPEGDSDDRKAWRSESSEEDDECTEGSALKAPNTTHDVNSNCKAVVKDTRDLKEKKLRGAILEEEVKSDYKKWLIILCNWRCWAFIVSIFISTFSWSFYWVNLVSHLSNVGLTQRHGAFILTTCAAAELTSKILLALLGDRLPISNVTILAYQGLVTSAFTVGVMFIRDFASGMGVILGVGVMRGVYQVVPYMSCVEIIGSRWGDEAQTLTLVVQGLGYLVGALPSGAIYDITQSYQICLIMVLTLFIVSSVMLFMVQIYDKYCAKRKGEGVMKTVEATKDHFVLQSEVVLDKVTTV